MNEQFEAIENNFQQHKQQIEKRFDELFEFLREKKLEND